VVSPTAGNPRIAGNLSIQAGRKEIRFIEHNFSPAPRLAIDPGLYRLACNEKLTV